MQSATVVMQVSEFPTNFIMIGNLRVIFKRRGCGGVDVDELHRTTGEQHDRLMNKKQLIEDSQARYYRLLNAIHEVYYSADVEGNITEISPSVAMLAGYSCDEIKGRPATFFYRHPEDRATFLTMLQQQGHVSDYELELVHKDGSVIHASANAHMMFDENNNAVGVEGLLRDISERVELEEKLRSLNEQLEQRVAERTAELEANARRLRMFSQAIEQSAEAIIITDTSGHVEYVNPAFESINGYSADEVQGKPLSLLNSGKHNADFFHALWSTVRSGRVWEGTITNRRKDGSDYPALMTIVPVEHRGETEFYAAIQQDMSEYEKLEVQFRQAQKMDAIGTLVGGIAHDFNNMLSGLLMHLYLAKKSVCDPIRTTEKLEMAEKLGYQASEMIKNLMIFSRDEKGEKKALQLNHMLNDSMRLLRISVPEHIKLNLDVCEQPLTVMGDATQLQQVLMNMLNNARDALAGSDEGEINVALERFVIDQTFADAHPDVDQEMMAKLTVSDNGCGIPEQTLARVFDPFFTTKEAGHGTGLGLSMVYGCIESHGGILEVESSQGVGTTFQIYLPLITQQARLEVGVNATLHRGSGQLVLVADDNRMVRRVIVEALESLNYRAIQAEDGVEALRLFEEQPSEVALAILDMVMPKMSGREVAHRMRLINPAIPVLFATGHDEKAALRDIEGVDKSLLHEKPFKMAELSQAIHQLLH